MDGQALVTLKSRQKINNSVVYGDGQCVVYRGKEYSEMQEVGVSFRWREALASFDAKAGEEYSIAVVGSQADYSLSIETDRLTAHNRFEERKSISLPFEEMFRNSSAGFSPGDPPIARRQPMNTMWWKWRAREDGEVRIEAGGSF